MTGRRVWGVAFVILVAAIPAAGQSSPAIPAAGQSSPAITVVTTAMNGSAVPGALVGLVTQDEKVVTEGVTDARGRRTLSAPPGMYRLRVRRIGYAPFLSADISLPYDGELQLRLPDTRIALATVRVTAATRCRPRNDTRETGFLWEEISKALTGTRLSRDDLGSSLRARTWHREVDFDRGVISSDSTVASIAGGRPFVALDPRRLAREGYVRGGLYQGWQYFAPDEAVLLSEDFASTHCFRIVRERRRPRQVGLHFAPEPERRLSDIEGVIWLDEQSAELREIVFRYVNVPDIQNFDPKGTVSFRRMPSGAFVVDNWTLRLPRVELQARTESLRQSGYSEHGGAIIDDAAPATLAKGSARVRGAVFDSVSQKPLSGAVVSIAERVDTTGADGSFAIEDLPRGQHRLTVSHPALAAFGSAGIERAIDVDADSFSVKVATPSLRTLWLRLCRESDVKAPVDDRGIVHGFVKDESGDPLWMARVEFHWTPYNPLPGASSTAPRQSLAVRTGTDGSYVACGFPRLSRGQVVAATEQGESPPSSFQFDTGLLVRRDLVLSPRR